MAPLVGPSGATGGEAVLFSRMPRGKTSALERAPFQRVKVGKSGSPARSWCWRGPLEPVVVWPDTPLRNAPPVARIGSARVAMRIFVFGLALHACSALQHDPIVGVVHHPDVIRAKMTGGKGKGKGKGFGKGKGSGAGSDLASNSTGSWSGHRRVALVTGITGQDGSYLAELLLAKGYDVHGIVRRTSSFNTHRIANSAHNDRLHLHYGDLTDATSCLQIVTDVQPTEVYNLGAQSRKLDTSRSRMQRA